MVRAQITLNPRKKRRRFHTSSNCKQLPHSFNVMRWSSLGSHDFKNGSMQCSNDISGARIGNNSWIETERSCDESKSQNFQTAAFAQRRVKLVSASNCISLYLAGSSSRSAKSRITLNNQSRIRLGKSLISSSVQFCSIQTNAFLKRSIQYTK